MVQKALCVQTSSNSGGLGQASIGLRFCSCNKLYLYWKHLTQFEAPFFNKFYEKFLRRSIKNLYLCQRYLKEIDQRTSLALKRMTKHLFT